MTLLGRYIPIGSQPFYQVKVNKIVFKPDPNSANYNPGLGWNPRPSSYLGSTNKGPEWIPRCQWNPPGGQGSFGFPPDRTPINFNCWSEDPAKRSHPGVIKPDSGWLGHPTTVGTNGRPSAYGVYDLSGNVWEFVDRAWTDDAFGIKRGGSFSSSNYSDLNRSRMPYSATSPMADTGFRIASILNPPAFADPKDYCSSKTNAKFNDNFVVIGDPGNQPDNDYGFSPVLRRGWGAVNETFRMSKYPVTNCEYALFLNYVDPDGLNSAGLYYEAGKLGSEWYASGISYDPSKARGSKYVVKPYMGNKPVVYVSWYSAARYCNWLHNGRPKCNTVAESVNAISGGAYPVGAERPVIVTQQDVNRFRHFDKSPGARYFMPTESQWWKAAFYKGGGTNAGYWTYATQTNTIPRPIQSARTDNALHIGDGVIPVVGTVQVGQKPINTLPHIPRTWIIR